MHLFRKSFKKTWSVAATFIGTIVGAGFASGQEILNFFSHYGTGGIVGLILAGVFFCTCGTSIMLLGNKLQAVSFADVVRLVCGKRLGPFIDILLCIFLFITLSVMLAGAGAVLLQQWEIPYRAGIIFTVVISILTVLFGLKGITKVNSIIVPVMILFCIIVTFPSISSEQLKNSLLDFSPVSRGAAFHWLISALLYVSYNMTLSVSVLAPLGREIKNTRTLILGGIIGGLVLGALAMIINLAILTYYPDSANYEVPSLFVAGSLPWIIQFIFSFILWAEIFTTIIGTIYGLSMRISDFTGVSYIWVSTGIISAAVFLANVGFSNLVAVLYPLIGYVSFVFLFSLLIFPLLKKIS